MKCFIRGYKNKVERRVQKGKGSTIGNKYKLRLDKIKIDAEVLMSSRGGVVELLAKQP
jgi:hypothetical protein